MKSAALVSELSCFKLMNIYGVDYLEGYTRLELHGAVIKAWHVGELMALNEPSV